MKQVNFAAWTDEKYEQLTVSMLKKPADLLELQCPVLHALFRDCFLQQGGVLRPGFSKENASHCLILDSVENDVAFLKLYGLRLLQERQRIEQNDEDDHWMRLLLATPNEDDEADDREEIAVQLHEYQQIVGTLLLDLAPAAEVLLRQVSMSILAAYHLVDPVARLTELVQLRSSESRDGLPCSWYRTKVNPANPEEYILLWTALSGKQMLHRVGTTARGTNSSVSQNVLTVTHETLLRMQLDFCKQLIQALWSVHSNHAIPSSSISYAFPGSPVWNGQVLATTQPIPDGTFYGHYRADLAKFALVAGLPQLSCGDLRRFQRQKARGNDPEFAGFDGLSGRRADICARLMANPAVAMIQDQQTDQVPEELPDHNSQAALVELVADMLKAGVIDSTSLARGSYAADWQAQRCNSQLSDGHYQPSNQWAAFDMVTSTLAAKAVESKTSQSLEKYSDTAINLALGASALRAIVPTSTSPAPVFRFPAPPSVVINSPSLSPAPASAPSLKPVHNINPAQSLSSAASHLATPSSTLTPSPAPSPAPYSYPAVFSSEPAAPTRPRVPGLPKPLLLSSPESTARQLEAEDGVDEWQSDWQSDSEVYNNYHCETPDEPRQQSMTRTRRGWTQPQRSEFESRQAASNRWDPVELIAICHLMVEMQMNRPSGSACWAEPRLQQVISTFYPILSHRAPGTIAAKLKNSWRTTRTNLWQNLRPLTVNFGLRSPNNLAQAQKLVEEAMQAHGITMADFLRPPGVIDQDLEDYAGIE